MYLFGADIVLVLAGAVAGSLGLRKNAGLRLTLALLLVIYISLLLLMYRLITG